MRILSLFCLNLAFLAGVPQLLAQNQLSLVRLQEDVQLLSDKVGRLQLEIEVLQRENAELRQSNTQLQQAQQELVQSWNATIASMEQRLAEAAVERTKMKNEVVTQMRSLIEDFSREMERELARAQATTAPADTASQVDLSGYFPKSGIEYTVKRGETLSGIAARNQSKVIWIQRANKIARPETVQAGQSLFVPQEN